MTPSPIAEDLRLTPSGEGPGTWDVALSERWGVGRNQNGGVLLATVAGAMAEVAGHPHPFSATAHFLGPAEAGPATVHAEAVKPGRTYATAVGRLHQGDRERVRVLGAFGDLDERAEAGPSPLPAPPPPGPPPDACDDLFDLLVASVGERALTRSLRNYEIRVDPHAGWGRAGPEAPPALRGWVRMRDEPTVTPQALLAVADGFPPTVLGQLDIGWLPTVELTVHVLAAPPADEPWLRAELRTRSVVGGLLDEDGELWDAAGRLVARFRQLAMLIPRQPRDAG